MDKHFVGSGLGGLSWGRFVIPGCIIILVLVSLSGFCILVYIPLLPHSGGVFSGELIEGRFCEDGQL